MIRRGESIYFAITYLLQKLCVITRAANNAFPEMILKDDDTGDKYNGCHKF